MRLPHLIYIQNSRREYVCRYCNVGVRREHVATCVYAELEIEPQHDILSATSPTVEPTITSNN